MVAGVALAITVAAAGFAPATSANPAPFDSKTDGILAAPPGSTVTSSGGRHTEQVGGAYVGVSGFPSGFSITTTANASSKVARSETATINITGLPSNLTNSGTNFATLVVWAYLVDSQHCLDPDLPGFSPYPLTGSPPHQELVLSGGNGTWAVTTPTFTFPQAGTWEVDAEVSWRQGAGGAYQATGWGELASILFDTTATACPRSGMVTNASAFLTVAP